MKKTISAMENTLIVIIAGDTAEEKINLKTRSQSNYPKWNKGEKNHCTK